MDIPTNVCWKLYISFLKMLVKKKLKASKNSASVLVMVKV